MGSKAPLPNVRPSGELPDDKAEHAMLSRGTAAQLLLRRIADALQVPQAALYNSPDAVASPREADNDSPHPIDLDQERMALLRAYASILDPEERRRILMLVQKTAEQV